MPNLLSIPENIGRDTEYPPMWSGLWGFCTSPANETLLSSDPDGRLK